MKLISMSDFVLTPALNKFKKEVISQFINHTIIDGEGLDALDHKVNVKYARFLQQKLKLEMFVSKDESKVLFKGFYLVDAKLPKHKNISNHNVDIIIWIEDDYTIKNKTIENLVGQGIELTEASLKQFL